MNHPPPVIATNKWTKMWPPVVWVACFLAIPGVVAGAVAALCRAQDQAVFDINEEDVIGIDDSKSFIRQDQVRFRKVHAFLSAHGMREKMMALTLAIKHQLHLMGSLFSAFSRFAKRDSATSQAIKDRQSIILLMCSSTSPARATILRCVQALRTPSDPFLVAPRRWDWE